MAQEFCLCHACGKQMAVFSWACPSCGRLSELGKTVGGIVMALQAAQVVLLVGVLTLGGKW